MKKYKIINKFVTIILALFIPLFAFSGCSSNNSTSNNQNSVKKVTNKDEIKKTYDADLKKLEKDSTITKEQSASVLNALMGTVNKATGNTPKAALDKLVKEKVITQDQENKIIDALKIK
ncbi:uncharacterized protein YcfL [Clostridium acetobutylicum]|uniref:Lipoprotein n=1 Tax=Clostridium acetobutylicum (strain ATCC 824 / DSM 792 / JCM 1419 / IAM 19013 / LMG 5710 / NBRC 13948 / NRRL B-527 / VKM B-1787 / 2291 / W) TaxID=272562 RepID=Q97HM5_CLOAB|nr:MULTISPECIES: hypothetical protein [Clostridium]AAK79945.1 Hypothetical protein CA_C1985 [Clostridium acetobutylicum ATCC 824]ADZ21038.1 Conserved hypothetical protein [Clostridium acetobutylicum EA 2018]AEI32115.1 hypothetical protein SMB_G2017 [Clostridium acetobutylicum DSM 1731]AWV79623.1 hypothetical protein DK921_05815 [Clostridium acetobutylicum]MBC2394404.1 hypothetical protein [Clostridium acetobutylicum]